MILKALFLAAALLCYCAASTRAAEKPLPAAPRIVVRDGRFVDKKSGAVFVPRGFNYTRLGGKDSAEKYHVTFSPSRYDTLRAERMFADLQKNGFNIVRVFAAAGFYDAVDKNVVKPQFFENALDFLRRARRHNIRVIFTLDWIPPVTRYSDIAKPEPDDLKYVSQLYLNLPHIRAKAQFARDFIGYIKARDAQLLSSVFSWELENEAFLDVNAPPFSRAVGTWNYQGKTYDLSRNEDLQEIADIGARQWANALSDAIRAADPKALVAASVFTFHAVGRSGAAKLRTDKTADTRFPLRPLALAKTRISYLDIHLYAFGEEGLQRDLDSIEWPRVLAACRAAGKPLVMGEFGAFTATYKSAAEAAPAIRAHLQRVAKLGFQGFMMWTYDTHEQHDLYNGKSEGGVLFDAFKDEMRVILPQLEKPSRVLAGPAKEKVLLRLKLKTGQRYIMHVSTDSAVMQKLMGAVRQNSTLTVETRVLAVASDGVITTQTKITRIKMAMDINGHQGKIDTAIPRAPGEPFVGTYRSIIGVPLTAQFTPTGKMLGIKGVDVMMGRLMAGMPQGKGAPSAEEKRQIEASIRKTLNPEKLQLAGLNVLPERAVGIDDTWRDESAGGTSLVPSYRLVKRSGGIATVLVSGSLRGTPKIKRSSGFSMKQETTTQQNLRIEINEKTGLTRSRSGAMSTNNILTLSSSEPNQGAPQTATTSSRSRIRMTISDR